MMAEGCVLLNEASVLFGRVRKYWAKRHFKIRPAVMMGESQNERYATPHPPHFFGVPSMFDRLGVKVPYPT